MSGVPPQLSAHVALADISSEPCRGILSQSPQYNEGRAFNVTVAVARGMIGVLRDWWGYRQGR